MAERQKQQLWLCMRNESHPQGYCEKEGALSSFISFLCSFTLPMALHSLFRELKGISPCFTLEAASL